MFLVFLRQQSHPAHIEHSEQSPKKSCFITISWRSFYAITPQFVKDGCEKAKHWPNKLHQLTSCEILTNCKKNCCRNWEFYIFELFPLKFLESNKRHFSRIMYIRVLSTFRRKIDLNHMFQSTGVQNKFLPVYLKAKIP